MFKLNKNITVLFFFSCFLTSSLLAQNIEISDIIITRDGNEIPAIVLIVGDSDIQYKKASNPDGPTYTQKKTDIFMIKYKNGEKDVFQEKVKNNASELVTEELTSGGPKLIDVPVSEDNESIIQQYQNYYTPNPKFYKPEKVKTGKFESYPDNIFGITSSSTLSNDVLLIEIINKQVVITNKTDKILYIDLEKSFYGGSCFYNSDITVSSENTSVGGGVNILGVGVGSAKAKGSTTIKQSNKINAIAPYESELIFAGYNWGILPPYIRDICVEKWDMKKYTEENSPYTRNITITYSLSANFATYSQVSFTLYLKQVLGYDNTSIFSDSWIDPDKFYLGPFLNNE